MNRKSIYKKYYIKYMIIGKYIYIIYNLTTICCISKSNYNIEESKNQRKTLHIT